MANQYLLIATELYRKVFGHNAIRERYKGRKDAFFEFHVNEESQADQQTLKRLSSSIVQLSNQCFKECVQTNYKIFTTEEQACIRNCVKSYFKGYEEIVFYTDSSLNQN